MTIQILAVGRRSGKARRPDKDYFKEALADYRQRIARHCKFEIIEVSQQDGKCSKPREREGELLLKKLARLRGGQHSYCIALTPKVQGISAKRVQLYSSEELAALIAALQRQGVAQLYFVIGGSDGLSDAVLKYADLLISFSPLTFPHQLFRLLLCEQIYRCLKINSGQTYHK